MKLCLVILDIRSGVREVTASKTHCICLPLSSQVWKIPDFYVTPKCQNLKGPSQESEVTNERDRDWQSIYDQTCRKNAEQLTQSYEEVVHLGDTKLKPPLLLLKCGNIFHHLNYHHTKILLHKTH